jgi:hypothetical protein
MFAGEIRMRFLLVVVASFIGLWNAAHAQNYPVELRTGGATMATGSSAESPSTMAVALVNIPTASAWAELRVSLPAGVHYLGQSEWGTSPQLPTTCDTTVRADGGEDVVCRSTGITASTRSHFAMLQFAIDIDAPLGSDYTFSILYSAHLPGTDPNFTTCATTGGRVFVGCAELSHTAIHRKWTPRGFAHGEILESGVSVMGAPFKVGSHGRLAIDWNYTGSIVPGFPAVAHVLFPPHITYAPLASYPPASGVVCATQIPINGREHLRCEIPFANMSTYHSLTPLIVQVGRDVAGGLPVEFNAVVDAGYQPMPEDWFENPEQVCDACFAFSVPTVGPRAAISTVLPVPSSDWVVNRPYQFDIWLRNNEVSGVSGTLHLHVQFPPGMNYVSHEAPGYPVATCSAQSSTLGQVLTCSWASPLGPQDNRRLLMTVTSDTTLAAPGPVPVLFALEESATPDAGPELDRCEANPDVPTCFLIHRRTRFDCASQFTDGLYCDGFEVFVRPDP